jgi:integrase
MPKLTHRLPKYRLHRPSGQAVVTLNGFDHYLGTHGSEASKQAYQRKVSEWVASSKLAAAVPSSASDFTVDEVFIRYWAHVTAYYVKDGQPTGEQHALRSALTPLVNLYGPTRAADFGPLQLKAVREWMIKQKLSRRLINQRVNRVRRMFKWAVENAYLNPAVLQGLQAVSPLKRGRCEAPDTDPVRPLPEDVLEKTIEHMSPEVAAMARLQWHTGMRPGEVVIMRTRDIDQGQTVWRYRPASHKTQHHGIERVIPIGPKARAIVQPFLRADPDEYLFSPARKMLAWNEQRKQRRSTPMTPSQAARAAKRRPKKPAKNWASSRLDSTSSTANSTPCWPRCRRRGRRTTTSRRCFPKPTLNARRKTATPSSGRSTPTWTTTGTRCPGSSTRRGPSTTPSANGPITSVASGATGSWPGPRTASTASGSARPTASSRSPISRHSNWRA